MITLYDNDSDEEIGQITDAQLEFLQENLVEETLDAFSYNLTPAALSALEASGADAPLLTLLRRALGTRPSIEMRYEPE